MSAKMDLDDIEHIEEHDDAFHAHRSDGRILHVSKKGMDVETADAIRSIAKGKAAALLALQNMPGDDGVTRAEEGADVPKIEIANNDPEDVDEDNGLTPDEEQSLINESKNPATQQAAHDYAQDVGDNGLEFLTRDQQAKVQAQKEAVAYGRGKEPKPAPEGQHHARGLAAMQRGAADADTRALGDTVPADDNVLDAGFPADNSVDMPIVDVNDPTETTQALAGTVPPEGQAPSTGDNFTPDGTAIESAPAAPNQSVPGTVPAVAPAGLVWNGLSWVAGTPAPSTPAANPELTFNGTQWVDPNTGVGPNENPIDPRTGEPTNVSPDDNSTPPAIAPALTPEQATDQHALAVFNSTRDALGGTPPVAPATDDPKLLAAEEERQKANRQAAQAYVELSRQQVAAQEESLRRVAAIQAETAAKTAENEARLARTHDWLARNPVDPRRLYHEQSTGDAILSFIGLILSGAGSGLTHTSNMAMDVLQRAVQDDIEAQKSTINTQKSRVRDYMEQGHNIENAGRLAMSDELAHAAGMMSLAAFKSGGSLALAAMHDKSGLLMEQANQFMRQARVGEMQERELPIQYAGANEHMRLENEKLKVALEAAKNPKSKFVVRFGPGDELPADSATQKAEVDKRLAALNVLEEQLSKAESMGRTGIEKWTESGGEGEATRGAIGAAMTQMAASGGRGKVFQESLEKMLPGVGDIRQGPMLGKIRAARSLVLSERNAIRRELGGKPVAAPVDFTAAE